MDLDAELARIQDEARREVAEREQRLRARGRPAQEGEEPDPSLPPVAWPKGIGAAGQLSRAGDKLKSLEGKAAEARALPFKAKLALAAVGVVGALAAWHFVLAPLLSVLLTLAVLVGIVYALVYLFGADDQDADDPGDDGVLL